jgi:ATP-binding cassette subfamily B protein
MWARAVRIRWRHLFRLADAGPVVLLFEDGGAGLLAGADAAQNRIFIRDPFAPPGAAPVGVDELRLAAAWAGEAVLLRANRGLVEADAPFNFRWLVALIMQERRSLRDIGLASFTVSILTAFPPILVMTTVNKVMQLVATEAWSDGPTQLDRI